MDRAGAGARGFFLLREAVDRRAEMWELPHQVSQAQLRAERWERITRLLEAPLPQGPHAQKVREMKIWSGLEEFYGVTGEREERGRPAELWGVIGPTGGRVWLWKDNLVVQQEQTINAQQCPGAEQCKLPDLGRWAAGGHPSGCGEAAQDGDLQAPLVHPPPAPVSPLRQAAGGLDDLRGPGDSPGTMRHPRDGGSLVLDQGDCGGGCTGPPNPPETD